MIEQPKARSGPLPKVSLLVAMRNASWFDIPPIAIDHNSQ